MKRKRKIKWYRNLRAYDLKLDRRLQQRSVLPKVMDDTERTCPNCAYQYVGRVCPQCGQVGTWERYSWRQAILNFLDIWGLGNRPMFRTLRELFVRPGYMVRDYLSGHRQFYFPPFKLLAVAVVMLLAISWAAGVKIDSILGRLLNIKLDQFHPRGAILSLSNMFKQFIQFLSSHMLYEWLVIGVIALLCIWAGFRRLRRHNFVETYIFLIFILAQVLICRMPVLLLSGLDQFVEAHFMPSMSDGFLFLTMNPLTYFYQAFEVLLSRVELFYFIAVCFLVLLGFRQFYGLKWKTTAWRLFLSAVVFVTSGFLLLMLLMIYYDRGLLLTFYAILTIALMVVPFFVADRCLIDNKASINGKVKLAVKASMLTVLITPLPVFAVHLAGLPFLLSVVLIVLYPALVTFLSVLPIYVYKRYRNIWLSLIPVVACVAIMCITYYLVDVY